MAQTARPGEGPALRLASRQGRWVLFATVLGSAMASIDATVVGIALPAIGHDFGATLAGLQWVVTAYTLTLSGLLLVAGALGDRYGRRRVFQIGVVWFALASVLCGAAPTTGVLVGARALQGVGAALLTPGSLAIIEASFHPDDRGKAIGAWSGFSGVGTAIGPFLGGWLIQAVSWRLIFAINLPVAAGVLAVAWRHVPESRDPDETGRVDLAGGALVTLGLVGLTYGLIDGPSGGFARPAPIISLAAGAALLVAFVLRERRARMPVLPLSLFSSAQFNAANAITFVVYAALGGALFLLPLQLEQVCHYSPLQAGISLLPVTVIMLALSARSGALAARIGPRLQMTAGPADHRGRARPAGQDRPVRELPDRGAARGAGVRAGPGGQRGPADRHRAGRGPGPQRRSRLGRQQRRGQGGRPDRGRGAAGPGRPDRQRLPARRSCSRPDSARPVSCPPGCACSAGRWPRR